MLNKLTWMLICFTCVVNSDAQDTILVKCKDNVNSILVDNFHRRYNCKITKYKHFNWQSIKFNSSNECQFAFNKYSKSKLFTKVSYNSKCSITTFPNDILYSQQWNLFKIQASLGWNLISFNPNVVVAVIDTGIDYNHVDIKGSLWTGPSGEHGYTAKGGVITNGGFDDHFHGTHVAGIIGATGNNNIGVVGINWLSSLISFKFLDSTGYGYSEDAALCIDKMIDLKLSGVNIRICNNSWGLLGYDFLLEDAFNAAYSNNIISICAAGNNNLNTDDLPFSPASLNTPGIVSVLASDINDNRATFSNFGSKTTDVFAPGVNILSLSLGDNNYFNLSGTSMASPHVAGLVSLMLGLNPNLNTDEIKNILLSQDSLDSTLFYETSTFGGRININKTLNNVIGFNFTNNHKPTLSVFQTKNILNVNESTTISSSAFDVDNDNLNYSVFITPLGDTLNQEYHSIRYNTNSVVLINQGFSAIAIGYEIKFVVSDGKGGTDFKTCYVLMNENSNLKRNLTADLDFRFINNYPFKELFLYSNNVSNNFANCAIYSSKNHYFAESSCCFSVNTNIPYYRQLQFGPNLFRSVVVDNYGNIANSDLVVVDTNNTSIFITNLNNLSLNTTRGRSPLTVNVDFGINNIGYLQYYSRPWIKNGFFDIYPPLDSNVGSSLQTFVLTNIGTYAIEFVVHDTITTLKDKIVQLFTILPNPILNIKQANSLIIINWDDSTPADILESSTNLIDWNIFNVGSAPVILNNDNTVNNKFFRLR